MTELGDKLREIRAAAIAKGMELLSVAEILEETRIRRSGDINKRKYPLWKVFLKEQIKEYFNERHGDVIYPSDIANHFDIDYELAEELIDELVKGKRVKELKQALENIKGD